MASSVRNTKRLCGGPFQGQFGCPPRPHGGAVAALNAAAERTRRLCKFNDMTTLRKTKVVKLVTNMTAQHTHTWA